MPKCHQNHAKMLPKTIMVLSFATPCSETNDMYTTFASFLIPSWTSFSIIFLIIPTHFACKMYEKSCQNTHKMPSKCVQNASKMLSKCTQNVCKIHAKTILFVIILSNFVHLENDGNTVYMSPFS